MPPRRTALRSKQAEANAQALSPLSEDGRTGIIAFNYDVETPMDIKPASQDALIDIMDKATESV